MSVAGERRGEVKVRRQLQRKKAPAAGELLVVFIPRRAEVACRRLGRGDVRYA